MNFSFLGSSTTDIHVSSEPVWAFDLVLAFLSAEIICNWISIFWVSTRSHTVCFENPDCLIFYHSIVDKYLRKLLYLLEFLGVVSISVSVFAGHLRHSLCRLGTVVFSVAVSMSDT